jgi:hypothetical protein
VTHRGLRPLAGCLTWPQAASNHHGLRLWSGQAGRAAEPERARTALVVRRLAAAIPLRGVRRQHPGSSRNVFTGAGGYDSVRYRGESRRFA